MIGALLHHSLSAAPERPALIEHATEPATHARTWSAGELDDVAVRWAGKLAGKRRVALRADNGLDLVGAFLGALYAGAAVVPFHVGTPPGEVEARMRRFAVELLLDADALAAARPHVAPGGALAAGADDAPALLLGTSGTTGEPRAVVVTRGGLARHALALVQATGLGPGDRVLASLPLAHSYGCRMALLVPLLAGACVVVTRRFSARGTLRLMSDEAVSWAPAVPTMLSAWSAVALEHAPVPRGLRWVLSAGAPLPAALRSSAEARLGCEIREGYGLTEASFTTLDAPPAPRSPGTVGQPVPGAEVRLDPATGEVEVRGQHVMPGYLDDEAATAAAFTSDGWLRTGDVGALDARGNLRIVDRIKDVILSGGYSIYPAEVEAVLTRHPMVAAVAVVGRRHAHLGEQIVAHVVPRPGAPTSQLPALLTDWSVRWLAPHKVPAEVVLHTELPLGPSGKVLKRRLKSGLRLPDEGSGG